MNLTETAVRRLRLKNGERRRDVKDGAAVGLYLRLYSTGRRAWVFRYRLPSSRKAHVFTLGDAGEGNGVLSLTDARTKARDARMLVKEGRDPAALAQRAVVEARRMPTVGIFAAEYIERHAKPTKRTWREDERLLEREVIPYLGKLRLDEIKRRDVVTLIDRARERGAQVLANRLLAVVRRMFVFGVERGILEANPVVHIRAQAEHPRERVLTDAEIRALWKATAPPGTKGALPLGASRRLAVRLCLLTSARAGEVAGMERAELDLEQKDRWNLPGERSKNRLPISRPIAPEARRVLEEALEAADKTAAAATTDKARERAGRYVFPAVRGGGPVQVTSLSRAVRDICGEGKDPPRLHDLRRTVATRLGELGVARLIIDRVLHHKDRTIGGVYDRHGYEAEMRKALMRWERALLATLEKRPARKVVSIARGGRKHDR